jgi:hypothetical protein
MSREIAPSSAAGETKPGNDIVAFTLCEPGYAAGAAALFNSLIAAGFAGTFIVGLKGEPAGWLQSPPENLPAGGRIRIVATPGDRHLTHGKARFAQRVFDELDPGCAGVAYFDPDVVVKTTWAEIGARIRAGCSVCADENAPPWEGKTDAWSAFARQCTGLSARMEGACCNGGFVGVMREHRAVVDLWESLLRACFEQGFDPGAFVWNGPRTLPFFFVDQDMLNLAIRVAGVPFWIGGPETMDFAPGGKWLSHAISTPKPWARWYLPRVLTGRSVRRCDIAFWKHAAGPIPAVPATQRALHRLDLAVASAISRQPA